WGSPIAANNRSAELAYLIGSLRHDSRYSAIDMSLWLRASKDRANALNRESLYMISLRIWSASLPKRLDAFLPGPAIESARAHKAHWTLGEPDGAMHYAGKPVSYEQAIAYSLGENASTEIDSYQMSPSSNIRRIVELAMICISVNTANPAKRTSTKGAI